MTASLLTYKLVAPGSFGITITEPAGTEGRWASDAENAVIDDNGWLAARKGRAAVTTSAVESSALIQQLFEQVDDDGTLTLISAVNNKLYKGTTTLTDITGTAGALTGITANDWQFQNIAGALVGFQAGHDPIYRTTGNFALLQQQIPDWAASTAYAVGDVVKIVTGGGGETYYFHCTTAGTSHSSEPTWDTTEGNTTTDNTVTWTARVMPNGNICHSAFGRIWTTRNGDDSTIYFSDTLLPYKFSGGASGTLDLTTVWGGDKLVGIGSVEDLIVFFGQKTILIYSGAEDPTALLLEDKIEGIGMHARDSLQSNGKDLIWLSRNGVRTLQRTVHGGVQPVGDLSQNVQPLLKSLAATNTNAQIKSAYSEVEGFYVVSFLSTTETLDYVFDLRWPNPDGSAKVTRWRGYNAYSWCASRDGNLYSGGEGIVNKYDGYNDGASGTYQFHWRSIWLEDNSQFLVGRFKIPKRVVISALLGRDYTLSHLIGYNYNDALTATVQQAVTVGTIAYWNVAEWNEGEWSGGDTFGIVDYPPSGFGYTFKLGEVMTVDGAPFALQSVMMQYKLGRLVG